MKKFAILAMAVMLSGCAWMNPFNWGSGDKPATETAAGFEPNPFLWQAAQDKLAFMQTMEENKSKGIIYKWWTSVEGNEKVKYSVGVKISSDKLRSDCLEAAVLKRVWNGKKWVEEPQNPALDRKVEEAILERARVLYRESLNLQ